MSKMIETPYGKISQETHDSLSDSERAWLKFLDKTKEELE